MRSSVQLPTSNSKPTARRIRPMPGCCWTTWASSCAMRCRPLDVATSGRPPPKNTSEPDVKAVAPRSALSSSAARPLCTRTLPRSAPIADSKCCRILVGMGAPLDRADSIRSLVAASSSPPSGPIGADATGAPSHPVGARRGGRGGERPGAEPLDDAAGDLVGAALGDVVGGADEQSLRTPTGLRRLCCGWLGSPVAGVRAGPSPERSPGLQRVDQARQKPATAAPGGPGLPPTHPSCLFRGDPLPTPGTGPRGSSLVSASDVSGDTSKPVRQWHRGP